MGEEVSDHSGEVQSWGRNLQKIGSSEFLCVGRDGYHVTKRHEHSSEQVAPGPWAGTTERVEKVVRITGVSVDGSTFFNPASGPVTVTTPLPCYHRDGSPDWASRACAGGRRGRFRDATRGRSSGARRFPPFGSRKSVPCQ